MVMSPLLRPLGLAPPTAQQDQAAPRPTAAPSEKLDDAALIELAERFIASDFGTSDPSLLAEGFEFCGPVVGPLPKESFVAAWKSLGVGIAESMPDLDYHYRDASVCPYDVNRVWYTSSPTGTQTAPLRLGEKEYAATGRRWISPPG